jgi:shikimate kinase
MQIVLLGYMGSGKSTIGRLLAKDLDSCFLDLDSYIEEAEEKPIATVFREKGEVYFRKKEAESLREILKRNDDFVLSIGGGTPCYANNMKAISETTPNVFYLKVSIEELVNRLSKEKSERPLIQRIPDQELTEFIAKHLFERSFFYNQAFHKMQCDGKNTLEVVAEIKTSLS